jgi:hypothetical protein
MNAVILRNILAFFNIDELVINTRLSYSILYSYLSSCRKAKRNKPMKHEIYIGVMSGTSLDGVDLVAVSFEPLQLHATLTSLYQRIMKSNAWALPMSHWLN